MGDTPGDVTQLLVQWRNGDKQALPQLMPLVYNELKAIAGRYLRSERSEHTLQCTALVHEAYLRLESEQRIDWKNRVQFLAVAATMIRNILVDHARARRAAKRGGGAERLALEDANIPAELRDPDILAIDDALFTLNRIDPQQSRIVELRFFGGLTIEETAEALDISPSTVKRDWILARTWIAREISNGRGGAGR